MSKEENQETIKYQLTSIEDLFQEGKCAFRIPDFQRGYSWESKERKDLMEDIEYAIESKFSYKHFTGTIVTSLNERYTKEKKWPVYDIVDGQQRLTTLLLILSEIFRQLEQLGPNEEINRLKRIFISEEIGVGQSIRKLYAGRDQDQLFKAILLSGNHKGIEIDTKSDQNLKNASVEISTWLASVDIRDVKKCILENLGFLHYSPVSSKELGIMFEVINNRGKGLSQLEKIKNYLFYYSEKNQLSDLKETIINSWPNILSRLNKVGHVSNDEENSFLRNCWIVAIDTNKTKSAHVYEQLKQRWKPDSKEDWKSLQSFVTFLESASLHYYKIFNDGADSNGEKIWLNRLRHHPQIASVLPVLLAIFEKIERKDHRADLFELIEKLNFRYYVSGIANRSDSGQGELFGIAHGLYNYAGEHGDDGVIDFHWMKKKLVYFIQRRANDNTFLRQLIVDEDEPKDFYKWNGLKFFLGSYEEKLRNDQKESFDISKALASRNKTMPNDFFHREHIWAIGDHSKISDHDAPNINKRRLGNFIILKETINIKISTAPPEKKVDDYFKFKNQEPNTWMIRELKNFFEEAKEKELSEERWKRLTKRFWTETYQKFLDIRETKLLRFALKRWGVRETIKNLTSEEIMINYSKTGKDRYRISE
jgi:hypothetical protein